MRPTAEQITRILAMKREWESGPPPCGISHVDIYNPCLPERDERGWLFCCTCGMSRRPAITAGGEA